MQRKWLGALAVILLFPAAGMAQSSASATATVTVQQNPITLTKNQDLAFGTIVPFNTAGWVTISSTSSNTSSNVTVIAQGSPATFSVAGNPNSPFNLTLPADGTVTVRSGTNSMAVNLFRSSYGTTTPLLSPAGTAGFAVGARLLVGANQPDGIYSGTFTVTVAY